MTTIGNEHLEVTVKNAGAELTRIFHKHYKTDYLWNANAAFWGKHAPLLFPIVGTLAGNTYLFRDKDYHLPRHGFARDMDFRLAASTADSVVFELESSALTLQHYPFPFLLRIHYGLRENRLTNRYEVVNTGTEDLPFSIGGHPAFQVPLENGQAYEDYYLEFEQEETAPRWPLENNLISDRPQPFLQQDRVIPLHHALFAKDAIVLKHLRSGCVSLKSKRSPRGLTMDFSQFPYLGIWAAPDAPFVCLEPWQGIADSVDHDRQLETKEGIVHLPASDTWSKSWSVTFF